MQRRNGTLKSYSKWILCFMAVAGFLVLGGCLATFPSPGSTESSLIYGLLDLGDTRVADLMVVFYPYGKEDNEPAMTYNKFTKTCSMNRNGPSISVDLKTGVFACPVSEPGKYYLAKIGILPRMNLIVTTHYPMPEDSVEALIVGPGSMEFWGAYEINYDTDAKLIDLQPHGQMSQSEVLMIVEEMVGSRWSDQILREKERLGL